MAKGGSTVDEAEDGEELSFASYKAQSAKSPALEGVSQLIGTLIAKRTLDTDAVEAALVPIFVGLRASPSTEMAWYFPDKGGDYRPRHALNACRLAMYFGLQSDMGDARAVQLGIAGMLYDIGMWLDGMELALQPQALKPEDMAKIETAAAAGAELLAKVKGLDALCATVAKEHHERADGTGYPARIKAADQHPYSRLFQIIDSFLGMIEPRPWRKALTPGEAVQRLAVQAWRGYYHQPTFRDWLRVMGVHPVGSFVTLNTGELAIVHQSNPEQPQMPKIHVLADELLEFRPKPMLIDLAEERAFEIAGTFSKFPPPAKP